MAPVVPHFTEELWELTGNEDSVHQQQWPSWDQRLAADEQVEIPIQVNGKVRATIMVPTNVNEREVKKKAMVLPKIQQYISDGEISHVVYVPGKILNFLVD